MNEECIGLQKRIYAQIRRGILCKSSKLNSGAKNDEENHIMESIVIGKLARL